MRVIDDQTLRQTYRAVHRHPSARVGVIECADPAMANGDSLQSLARAATTDTVLADELLLHLRLRRWAQRAARRRWQLPPMRELVPAMALALSLVAVGVAFWARWVPEPEAPVYRGHEETGLQGTRHEEAPLRLSWPAPEPGSRVQAHLFDAELQPVWVSEWIEGSQLELPASVRAQMPRGSTYYWRLRSDDGFQQHWEPLSRLTIGGGDTAADPVQ
jgi:hypothetical protein